MIPNKRRVNKGRKLQKGTWTVSHCAKFSSRTILSLMDQYTENLDDIFQSLSDPTRRAIIARLGRGSASVTDLAKPFNIALPSFMKHIRQLERSGLIGTYKQGRVRTCTIEKDKFTIVDGWLKEQRTIWEARLDRLDAFAIEMMKEHAK